MQMWTFPSGANLTFGYDATDPYRAVNPVPMVRDPVLKQIAALILGESVMTPEIEAILKDRQPEGELGRQFREMFLQDQPQADTLTIVEAG